LSLDLHIVLSVGGLSVYSEFQCAQYAIAWNDK